jgi:hypothetical protein
VFGAGVRPLRFEAAVFDAMLEGWRCQQLARFFKPKTIGANLQAAYAFREHADCWPWQWRAEHADEYFSDLLCRPRGLRPATVRGYQLRLKSLLGYLVDQRYPWTAICRHEFDAVPVQIFDDYNMVARLSGLRVTRAAGHCRSTSSRRSLPAATSGSAVAAVWGARAS